jgi:hypothetical protein
VEWTLGWIGRRRRLSKDYERKVQTSETLLQIAMIQLIVRRLARSIVMIFIIRLKCIVTIKSNQFSSDVLDFCK